MPPAPRPRGGALWPQSVTAAYFNRVYHLLQNLLKALFDWFIHKQKNVKKPKRCQQWSQQMHKSQNIPEKSNMWCSARQTLITCQELVIESCHTTLVVKMLIFTYLISETCKFSGQILLLPWQWQTVVTTNKISLSAILGSNRVNAMAEIDQGEIEKVKKFPKDGCGCALGAQGGPCSGQY